MPSSGKIFPLIELILVRRPVAALINSSFSSVHSENSKYPLKSEVEPKSCATKTGRITAANVSQTAAKSHSKRLQTAVSRQSTRQSIVAYEGANRQWRLPGSEIRPRMAVNRQAIRGSHQRRRLQMSGRRQRNRAQNAVKRQSVGRQMAVNRQSIGAYGGANVSQTTAKSHSKRRQTAVSRIRQTAVNRRLRGCKCQSDDSEIALKTPPNGSQSAVKRQSIGAYGAANVSQMTAKSRSKRRQMAVSRQSIGAYGAANVSHTAAKSHSSRRIIFPPLLCGNQGASQNHRPPKRGNFNQRHHDCMGANA